MFVSRSTPRRSLVAFLLIVLSLTMIGGVPADTFPEQIFLPPGFQPEGIASGTGTTFYVGSIPTGAVYRGDFRTGEGAIVVQPQAGHQSIGLKYDDRTGLLFVAGGPTGRAFVYDAETGATVADILLAPTPPRFINDVVVTREAAYFTNSAEPVFYRVPLANNGELPAPPVEAEAIPLDSDFLFYPGQFNANGIAATPNGKTLIIVNSFDGALYTVDPTTGDASPIDLGGDAVPRGDGILLEGKTLYVVQNQLNQVAVIELDPSLSAGTIVDTITSPLFRVPTTIASFGDSLYVVNARFGTPPTPDTDYDVVRVPEE